MSHTSDASQALRVLTLICALSCGSVLLSGCRDFNEFEEYRAMEDGISLTAGNAVAHNKAVQTLDPWPREAGNTVIDIDGTRILDAVRKYQSGEPDNASSMNGAGGSSSVGRNGSSAAN